MPRAVTVADLPQDGYYFCRWDVLLTWHRYDAISELIIKATGGGPSHALLIIGQAPLIYAEQTDPRARMGLVADMRLEHYDRIVCGANTDIYHNGVFKAEQMLMNEVQRFLVYQEHYNDTPGMPYDYPELIDHLWDTLGISGKDRSKPEWTVCSGMVNRVFAAAGVPFSYEPLVDPRDIRESERFREKWCWVNPEPKEETDNGDGEDIEDSGI
jgi:hypothetical protein